jgi:hypothetical protein
MILADLTAVARQTKHDIVQGGHGVCTMKQKQKYDFIIRGCGLYNAMKRAVGPRLVCLEDLGRFYRRDTMVPNTDFLKNSGRGG